MIVARSASRTRGRRPQANGLRITRLSLKNWRNFNKLDVQLGKRVFVVGPNASGKSNFLDAVRFLHDLVSVGGGFQAAVERRGGLSQIRCLSARRDSYVEVLLELGSDQHPRQWTYELQFSQDKKRRPIIRRERVLGESSEVLNRPNDADRRDPERLTQTHLEQVNDNVLFRDAAEFLASVKYLHIVPQLVREPARSAGKRNDPYGGDFLEQIARRNRRTQKSRLGHIQRALRVAVPQLSALEVRADKGGTPHLRGKYQHWRLRGAWQTEDAFSDGTLRLMGLLWAALDGSGPLLLEEPELSLHAEVVRYLPQMFARMQDRTGRQLLISTHSPDLIRDDGIGLDEVLLLKPGPEGTQVEAASSIPQIDVLLRGGLSLPEVVFPRTKPRNVDQLSLFGDS